MLGHNGFPNPSDTCVRQGGSLCGKFLFLQSLAGFLRHAAQHLGPGFLLHDGTQLACPLLGTAAHHAGRLLSVLGGSGAVLLHLTAGVTQQTFLLLPGLLRIRLYLTLNILGVFLRLFCFLQRPGDLFLALPEHPGDPLARDEKQCAEQDDKVG